jgi:hypothetical protein
MHIKNWRCFKEEIIVIKKKMLIELFAFKNTLC